MLDIGCGEKPYLEYFRPFVRQYIGLEHPLTLHDMTKVDIFGTGTSLPFKAESFETVAAFQVLEHIPEPLELLREVFRVLTPGGYLILATPFMWGEHEQPRDYYRFTRYGLSYLIEKVGMTIVKIMPVTGYWQMAGLRFCYYLYSFHHIWLLRFPIHVAWLLVQLTSLFLDHIHWIDTDTGGFMTIATKQVPDMSPSVS
jgi:SAM-dependent methyltransferase